MPVQRSGTALAAQARSATTNSFDLQNPDCRGVVVVLDLTAFVTAASLTLKVQFFDEASAKYVDILAGAAVVAVSTVTYRVYPGLTAVANVDVNGVLPSKWRILVTHGNGNSHTYSVGYDLIP